MNEENEITQTEEIETNSQSSESVTKENSNTDTNGDNEIISQSIETSVSTPNKSTSTDEDVAKTEPRELLVVKETKTMETVEKKDNKSVTELDKRALEKQNLIYEICGLAVIIFLIVVVKLLIIKRRASVVTEKVTKKDKDFLKLVYHLNHVYTKTDNYLKQKS